MWTPSWPFGPYSVSSTSPATIVGSANGRSISAFTNDLPRNSSRTSTHAISVPVTAFTAATAIAISSVNFSAATASLLETAFQNPSQPLSVAVEISAASGSRTITLSHAIEMPSSGGRIRGRRATATGELLRGRDSKGLLDLRHRPLVGIEELVVDLAPAAELVNREQVLRRRELRLVDQRLVERAVALRLEDLLALLGAQERDEGLRLRRVLRVRRHRDRILDQDRLVRHDVVDVLSGLLRADRLVLVSEEDIALPVRERGHRVAGGLVLDHDVVEELRQVVVGLGLRLALLELCAIGGHDVPTRATRCERVRLDHLDAGLDQVVPGLDVLRVALANGERHDRVGDHALLRASFPAGRDLLRVDELVDIGRQRECDDVGRQAGDDRARLVTRPSVGLGEAHALARWGLVERRDQCRVGLLRRGVCDEAEVAATAASCTAAARARRAARRDHGHGHQ